jgi:hypothetical protein
MGVSGAIAKLPIPGRDHTTAYGLGDTKPAPRPVAEVITCKYRDLIQKIDRAVLNRTIVPASLHE